MAQPYMSFFIRWLNFYRNVKGRYDLMAMMCKWDRNYRRELIVTLLAVVLFSYSTATWNSFLDLIAMALEASIIMIQLGTEMSILPAEYRPSHGGVRYSSQLSTHIAYDELSFLLAYVYPVPVEEALGFCNPIAGLGICKDSPLVSDRVDDILMTREILRYHEEKSETNYIRSAHQLRYIAIRVANKVTHTTNGVKLELYDLADTLAGDRPMTVRKNFYYNGLLTAEAFRSRIFRDNLQGEREVFTDLTTYFPVEREVIDSRDSVRFKPDFYKTSTAAIGVTSLLLTENRRMVMQFQGASNVVGANQVCLGGSGSMNYSEMEAAGHPEDFRDVALHGMAREVCEETGMSMKWFGDVRKNTMLTGFFRWIDRGGNAEFVGITRAGNVPFAKEKAIDGDEIIRCEEIPITIDTPDDFHKVMAYLREHKVDVVLSSLMALHRMTVIAGYKAEDATSEQKKIYRTVSAFLAETQA
ncbi:MAG: hypothetical protein V1721_10190 [Pseudomonadota bacterium]